MEKEIRGGKKISVRRSSNADVDGTIHRTRELSLCLWHALIFPSNFLIPLPAVVLAVLDVKKQGQPHTAK